MKHLIRNKQDMRNLAIDLCNKFKNNACKFDNATILALNGDLGAGKTTFTKALAKELGIAEPITSPTFVIQKSYGIPKYNMSFLNKNINTTKNNWVNTFIFDTLVHIDAYRLESGVETHALDLQNTLQNKNNLVVIEWAGNIASVLPNNIIEMNFEYIDEFTRSVSVQDELCV